MRCSPSHLALPYLAVGLFLHSTLVVCLTALSLSSTNSNQIEIVQVLDSTRVTLATIRVDPALMYELWDAGWRIILAIVVVVVQSLLIVALLLERNRKRSAAQALAKSEERYRNVVESQTELICRYLPDTTIVFVNDAYCRYFQKTRDELIGSKFLNLIPEGSREASIQHVQSLIKNPRTEIHEHEVLRPDGSVGWQQWVDAVISRDGMIELQGIGRDITDRKLAQDALMVSEEFNRRIVESSSDCVKVLDLEGNLIYMSQRGQRLLEIDDVEK
jgi:PAS domain S-box-containing protein